LQFWLDVPRFYGKMAEATPMKTLRKVAQFVAKAAFSGIT
jgi:hypothetical protein